MEALDRAGWDDVIADLDWEEVKRILEPVTGRLSFGEELQLKARISGARMSDKDWITPVSPGCRWGI